MTKRASDQFLEMSDDALDYELENIPMTESCDVIRRKIRTLIDNGDMKVGEFQKAINVSSPSYGRFMSQHGPDKGAGSDVYMAAWAFFKKRELRGIKIVPNKKAKTGQAGGKAAVPSVEGIVLDGEMEDDVPVFDTCDEIRRKINLHLKKAGVTQAALLREIGASFHTTIRKPTSGQLASFRSKKGPCAGNTSTIFYGAYVYFEKLRIKQGKPKSKDRIEMEQIHGPGGLDRKTVSARYICGPNEMPVMDKYGSVEIVRGF